MRTPLLIAAALAVVASAAAAAGADINADDATLDDIASGSSAIEDCTDGLHLDVLHSDTYDDTINDWYVTGVRITAADHDTGGSILDDCLDMALSVAIDDDQDTNLVVLGPAVLTTDTITDGTITLPVDTQTLIPVRSAHETAALVDRNIDPLAFESPIDDPCSNVPGCLFALRSHGEVIAAVIDGDGSGSATPGDSLVLGSLPQTPSGATMTDALSGVYSVAKVASVGSLPTTGISLDLASGGAVHVYDSPGGQSMHLFGAIESCSNVDFHRVDNDSSQTFYTYWNCDSVWATGAHYLNDGTEPFQFSSIPDRG